MALPEVLRLLPSKNLPGTARFAQKGVTSYSFFKGTIRKVKIQDNGYVKRISR